MLWARSLGELRVRSLGEIGSYGSGHWERPFAVGQVTGVAVYKNTGRGQWVWVRSLGRSIAVGQVTGVAVYKNAGRGQ